MIQSNSTGSAVTSWQNFLKKQGYLNGLADGDFGPQTEAATKAFQTHNNLSPDGIVGPSTLAEAHLLGYTEPTQPTTPSFLPANTSNSVFDISHHNAGTLDFVAAKNAGMLAVFHKVTEGHTLIDDTYSDHETDARNAGLLWGAYHYATDYDGTAQANHMLANVPLGQHTLLVLDFEQRHNKAGDNIPSMTNQQGEDFINQIKARTGKYPILYGGNYLKTNMTNHPDSALKNCALWLSEYGPHARLPHGWNNWTFWQYTDGNLGPTPHTVAGIGNCDRDAFNGDAASLQSFWTEHSI